MVKHRKNNNKLVRFLFSYGLHLWLVLFLANIVIYYTFHYYSMGKTCFTPAQVQSDNRCLYIWSNKVYEKGSRSSPHMGHPCGTDITAVLPPSHLGNQAKYLLPSNVGDICVAPPVTPTPTLTPIPTITPTPTTPAQQPTVTPTPTANPTVTPTPSPTLTPTKPAATPTVVAPTAIPTTSVSKSPFVTFAFMLPGIGTAVGANPSPLHATRAVTLLLYGPTVNIDDESVQPLYTLSAQATYVSNSSSANYGAFEIQNVAVGSTVPSGSYKLALKTNQTTRTLVGTLTLLAGEVATVPMVKNVLAGDLNNDNKINVIDYNLLAGCFGGKTSSPSCSNGTASDFDDNGIIDGTDYILMLYGIRGLNK